MGQPLWTSPPAPRAGALSAQERMDRAYVAAVVILSPLTDLKIGGIQPVELLLLPALGLYVLGLIRNNAQGRLNPILIPWLRWYGPLLLGIATVSFIAHFDVEFFLPGKEFSLLKTAPWLSISRIIQLIAVVFGLLSVCHLCLRDPRLLRLAVRLYAAIGVVLAAYGIISFVLAMAGMDVPGVTNDGGSIRARGTFVEGGPFGLYLISVLAICRLGKLFRLFSGLRYLIFVVIVVVGLLLTFSKAAILALFVLLFLEVFLGRAGWRMRLGILTVLTVIAMTLAPLVIGGISGYIEGYQMAEEKMADLERQTGHFVQFDPASTLGRVAGAYIVPRIAADRPVFGIGLGNYSLVRNDPHYRGFIPPTELWDLPGLGLLGYTPELGIPMMVFLMVVLLRLPWLALRTKITGSLLFIALFPFTAHLLGVQITFFYPWLVSALAICALYYNRRLAQVNPAMNDLASPPPLDSPFGDTRPGVASIQVRDILIILLRKSWLIAILTMVCIAAAILVARIMGPAFTAEMIVASQPDSGSASASAAKSGILAALSGGGAGGSGSDNLDHYLTMLKDPSMIARARERTRLLEIMYPTQWNPASKSWNQPSGVLATLRSTLRLLAGVPAWIEPNDKEIAALIEDKVDAKMDRGTGYWQIQATLRKREDALELLNILHREADELVREQAQQRAANRIVFINRKLTDVRIAEHQRILIDLLAGEERKIILSNADENYSAMVISPPQASTMPSQPIITRILLIGGVLGLILGAIIAIALERRTAAPPRIKSF